jgi:hypothetical protein
MAVRNEFTINHELASSLSMSFMSSVAVHMALYKMSSQSIMSLLHGCSRASSPCTSVQDEFNQLWRGALVRQRRVDGGFCGLRAYVAGGGATGAPVVVVVVMNY